MKQHIHGLESQHDFKPWRPLFGHSDRAKLRKLEDDFPNPWHPVVRVHPVSGRRVLYVNRQFCTRIKDLKPDESDALLEFLYRQATIPEYQLRVKWQPNTLVMWDNRSVQHYASHDYYPARRTMACSQARFITTSAVSMRALASATLSWTAWVAPTGSPVEVALRLRAVPTTCSYAPCAQPSITPDSTYGPNARRGNFHNRPGLTLEPACARAPARR